MLSNAGLGKEFWAEAVVYASHLINRLPSAANGGNAPMEVWSGKPVTDYNSLHVFGCHAYYHVKESKLDPRAEKALFMGVSMGVKGYRLWNPNFKKILFSRDVTFDESSLLKEASKSSQEQKTNSVPQQVEFEEVIVESDLVNESDNDGSVREEVPT